MAMTVLNNTASMMTLGELNKNINKVGKDLQKVAKGQKINSAGDGSSDYAISEKMRVRLRALNQNEQNVQTGSSLLRTAEGGVQEQIEILKTIKEKVIDANNDSNTDSDRAVIQKEINEGFKQMEQIAQETDYNGRRLLSGEAVYHLPTIKTEPEMIPHWVEYDQARNIPNSSLNIIPDIYPTLDGLSGPFDVFSQRNPGAITAVPSLNLKASTTENAFSGGLGGEPKKITLDLASVYADVGALDGKGFTVDGQPYVFTTSPGKYYRNSDGTEAKKIDISGCTSFADVASAVATQFSSTSYSASVDDSGNIVFSTINNDRTVDEINSTPGMGSFSATGATGVLYKAAVMETVYVDSTESVTIGDTGNTQLRKNLSGGKNDIPAKYERIPIITYEKVGDKEIPKIKTIDKPISPYVPGSRASATLDFSSAPADSGVLVHGESEGYIIFSEDAAAPEQIATDIKDGDTEPVIYKVGKNYSGNFYMCGMQVSMSGDPSKIKFVAQSNGSEQNSWYIDKVSSSPVSYTYTSSSYEREKEPAVYVDYQAVTPLNLGGVSVTDSTTGPTYAHYLMNFSDGIKSNSNAAAEAFIAEMSGKFLKNDKGVDEYFFYDSAILSHAFGGSYESLLDYDGYLIDLNDVRQSVKDGSTVFDAVQKLFVDNLPEVTATDDGVDFRAINIGTAGNNEHLYAREGATAIHYDIDFNKVAEQIPEGLFGKGFRVYCGSDSVEWWNFEFTDRMTAFDATRPESGENGQSIKTMRINVSNAKTPGDVVGAIYSQTVSSLTKDGSKYNHYLRMEANTATGVLRLYDNRYEDLTEKNYYFDRQGKGGGLNEAYGWWKIADGLYDNVGIEYTKEDEWDPIVKGLYIHDNPKANMNIRIELPQTTLDQVFNFDPAETSIKEFNVLSKDMRQKLLGDDENQGILDYGIEYLTNANTTIGAQIVRLAQSENNIVTASENTQAAESTIRDADMAKAMTSYTKNNVLAQAAQSMLAQANQNASSVLSLLQ